MGSKQEKGKDCPDPYDKLVGCEVFLNKNHTMGLGKLSLKNPIRLLVGE